MHLGGLLSNHEARIALGYALSNSYDSELFCACGNLPRAFITRWLHAARLPFLNSDNKKTLSIVQAKWTSLLVSTRVYSSEILIWVFDFGPWNLPRLSSALTYNFDHVISHVI